MADSTVFRETLQSTVLASLAVIQSKDPRYITYRLMHRSDDAAIDHLSSRLEFSLPSSLKELFTKVAARFEFSWALSEIPSDLQTGQPIFAGKLEWDMANIEALVNEKNACQRGTVFEALWGNTIPFMAVGNGDFLAVAPDAATREQVYYLTPAEPPFCLMPFACGLFTFLLDYCRIACVCDAGLRQFYDPVENRIDPERHETLRWQEWLNSSDR